MYLHEELTKLDPSLYIGMVRDIKACKAAWNWFYTQTCSGKIDISSSFTFCHKDKMKESIDKLLMQSLESLPLRPAVRIGKLDEELSAVSMALGDGSLSPDFASTILSYCGVDEPGKALQSMTLSFALKDGLFSTRKKDQES